MTISGLKKGDQKVRSGSIVKTDGIIKKGKNPTTKIISEQSKSLRDTKDNKSMSSSRHSVDGGNNIRVKQSKVAGKKRTQSELGSQIQFPADDSLWDGDLGGEEEQLVGEFDPSEGFPSVSRQGTGPGASESENKKRSKSGGFESMGFSYPVYKGIKNKGCANGILTS